MGASAFQIEAWVEYAIGVVILLTRIVLRCWARDTDWQGDDYFSILCIVFLTGESVMLELIGRWGSIVGISDEVALSLTPDQKENIVKGSKADIAGWCLYISLIWCLKACMLFFYQRLTLDTRQRRLIIVAGVACICSYLATIFVVLLRCLPFEKNWQVYPYPGDECATPGQIFLTLVITNVSTDLLILYIPLPLLWVLQAPLSKKIAYGIWLTTGIFVIVASLLRCILSIKDANEVNVSTIWAIRETVVGVISVNLPILGPLLIRKCKCLAATLSANSVSKDDQNSGQPSLITFGRAGEGIRLERLKKLGKYPLTSAGWTTVYSSSQEHMVG
ncbi:hypothetical protein VHEMI02460 [[Torrubiella] hemipterigena]|uniref:Rhodopsin domain-containing protein n=1 Tax=[Torrubiella] hemipterigena TaxID=1531966 RepID=A0A0A1TAJ8_9HYPO|nr:hypothetical protein VHEMI02460 [[Torrubiella] hemipterigena]